jgi:hypothetical protein
VSYVNTSTVKPPIVYLNAVRACNSLIDTPEDGNLFAETYVGVVNTFYTCDLSCAFVGF